MRLAHARGGVSREISRFMNALVLAGMRGWRRHACQSGDAELVSPTLESETVRFMLDLVLSNEKPVAVPGGGNGGFSSRYLTRSRRACSLGEPCLISCPTSDLKSEGILGRSVESRGIGTVLRKTYSRRCCLFSASSVDATTSLSSFRISFWISLTSFSYPRPATWVRAVARRCSTPFFFSISLFACTWKRSRCADFTFASTTLWIALERVLEV
mmetsp:Transcript_51559/g.122782  ORF Transcript_51559/g.122782 Transcript_51559/m.122782 type:complete len:214 (+) Transcript_51559:678-1319(+)